MKVENVFAIKRAVERDQFQHSIDNQQNLFHGSKISNWVGLLSRGILMPKLVLSMGGTRTNSGWLGSGIYFADRSSTSARYATTGVKGTAFMLIARVALGNSKHYTKIDTEITAPPAGYQSTHGVKRSKNTESDFVDDEYVIYSPNQQQLEYACYSTF